MAQQKKGTQSVLYSQCWEDPRILSEALRISNRDDICSIGSAGDNSFALLLHEPRSLTVIDRNPAQMFLTELKIRALQTFEYDDFAGFLGARSSSHRKQLYAFLRSSLTGDARAYWDAHGDAVNQGVIHCGKFEQYLAVFRRLILPLVHNRNTIHQLLAAQPLSQQKQFYDRVWNNRRWQLLFRLFFSKFVLRHLGREPSCFRHVKTRNVAHELLKRIHRGVTELPVQGNYFLEYILTGHYHDLRSAHPYLSDSNFSFLKANVGRMRLVTMDLVSYLSNLRPGAFSRFNLSDLFEYMSNVEFERALRSIVRACRANGKLAYWTLFVPQRIPRSLADRVSFNPATAQRLTTGDRAFFYGSFFPCDVSATVGKIYGLSVAVTQNDHAQYV